MAGKKRKLKSAQAKQRQQRKAEQRKQAALAFASAPVPPDADTVSNDPRKSAGFKWDYRKERAAQLLAEGDLTVECIALGLGVVSSTIREWRTHAEFTARIEEIGKDLANLARRYLIARKVYRLGNLQDRLLGMQRIKDARASKLSVPVEEGGDSGLLVRRERMIGSGEAARPVVEYEFDAALAREMRETEKQAAQEAGQWVDKVAPTTPDGTDEYSGIPAPDLDEFRKLDVAERIRVLRQAVRIPPRDRAEPAPEV